MLMQSVRRVLLTVFAVTALAGLPVAQGEQFGRHDPSAPANPWNPRGAPTNRPTPRWAYRSPYRPQSFERPFDDVQLGPNRSRTIDPYGRLWMNF